MPTQWQLITQGLEQVTADWLVVPVGELYETGTGPGSWRDLDQHFGGLLTRLAESGELPQKCGHQLLLRGLTGCKISRLALYAVGKEPTYEQVLRGLLTVTRSLAERAETHAAFVLPPSRSAGLTVERWAQAVALAVAQAGAPADLFKPERSRSPLARVQLWSHPTDVPEAVRGMERGRVLGDAVNLARELVNRPPAEITPAGFAERAKAVAQQCGLRCEIWDETRLLQERMRALLAVGQGSRQPPRFVTLEYRAGGASAPLWALVGKGVTFDSGGLSLKPTDGMLTMKCDMAGAAAVLATMQAIAQLKLPVNVLGLMGLVENMPGGNAFKLGDVLKARNGVTIEVVNTDAEGRLVLADVLSYAVDRQVDRIIDLATLTGACVVALGEDVIGAMTNDQGLCQQVLSAAQAAGEPMWQLPMFDLYDELIQGDFAEIKNSGGRWGGAITAAKFLQRFVGGKPWVHLDIAGPAYAASAKPYRDVGGTGAGVRTLVELLSRAAGQSS
ncbi:MAG: hypothetical protein KatS3mg114_0694 [Planctomycetaceae bacterium]|nr:MAG: hypothetical protein KatS3mg114_0694 [Planctomycetaceae bacterium]